MRRDYNGLTGKEVLNLLIMQIYDKLSREGRLGESQVYHNVRIYGDLHVDSYPHEPETESFAVEASAGEQEPEAAKPRRKSLSFSKEALVPDLARDEIAEAPNDVALVMQR